ncbi:MAG: ceramidase domain-containing protein [Acidiferrobacterales bacterium]|nr:ceramidase domain-containing protein [Acidiferrobacterales bacterium]
MVERALSGISRHGRELALLGLIIASALAMMLVAPIPQSLAYHAFVDRRALWGIPNFLNVATNLPFLLVGAWGLAYCLRQPQHEARWSWCLVFLGTAAVCLGSAYYHWQPNSGTLVWDRLPMTIAFMALFVALLSEHVKIKNEGMWLGITLVAGVASVIYWIHMDDLRPYIWVQAAPFLVIACAMGLFEGKYTHRHFLVYGFVLYALAKVAEVFDAPIYALTQELLSGHSLKHLLAAAAVYLLYRMLKQRHAREPASLS